MLNHKIVHVASKKASARKPKQHSCYAVSAPTPSSKADKHARNNVHHQKKTPHTSIQQATNCFMNFQTSYYVLFCKAHEFS